MYGRFVAEVSNLQLRAKMRIQKSLFVAYATKSDFWILILALNCRFDTSATKRPYMPQGSTYMCPVSPILDF